MSFFFWVIYSFIIILLCLFFFFIENFFSNIFFLQGSKFIFTCLFYFFNNFLFMALKDFLIDIDFVRLRNQFQNILNFFFSGAGCIFFPALIFFIFNFRMFDIIILYLFSFFFIFIELNIISILVILNKFFISLGRVTKFIHFFFLNLQLKIFFFLFLPSKYKLLGFKVYIFYLFLRGILIPLLELSFGFFVFSGRCVFMPMPLFFVESSSKALINFSLLDLSPSAAQHFLISAEQYHSLYCDLKPTCNVTNAISTSIANSRDLAEHIGRGSKVNVVFFLPPKVPDVLVDPSLPKPVDVSVSSSHQYNGRFLVYPNTASLQGSDTASSLIRFQSINLCKGHYGMVIFDPSNPNVNFLCTFSRHALTSGLFGSYPVPFFIREGENISPTSKATQFLSPLPYMNEGALYHFRAAEGLGSDAYTKKVLRDLVTIYPKFLQDQLSRSKIAFSSSPAEVSFGTLLSHDFRGSPFKHFMRDFFSQNLGLAPVSSDFRLRGSTLQR